MNRRTVSREELHRAVWDKPLTALSKEFGVTATGLAKICDRHDVPRPPQGHWTKLVTGKDVKTTPLPPLGKDQLASFDIIPAQPKARQSPKEETSRLDAKKAIADFKELDDFKKLHPAVKAWVKQHRDEQSKRRQERRTRGRDVWGFLGDPIPNLTERDRYRFQATSTIFKALEKAGAKVVDAKIIGKFNLRIGNHTLECAIKEKMRQGLSKVDRSWSAYPDHHQHGLSSSGFLRFSVITYVKGSKLEWVETPKKSITQLLPKIVVSMIACGPRLDEEKAERDAWQRKNEEERRKRYEEQQRRELAERRWKHFRDQAGIWAECQRLQQFIEAIETQMAHRTVEDVDGIPVAEWLTWSKSKLAEMDPMHRELHELWVPPSRW